MIDINKKILITGANGFVGANLVHAFVSMGAKNVHIFLRESSNIWRLQSIIDKLHIHYVSLTDYEKLNIIIQEIKPDIIYHLAAAGSYIGRDKSSTKVIFDTNVLGTINLLNTCKDIGFDYFINTGSNSEYGEKNNQMNENDILEPNNEYGVTKASATMYCSFIGKKEKLPVYTFRLFAVYGYFEDKSRLIPSLIASYQNNAPPSLSQPYSVRDFIFIEDVVSYYLHIDVIKKDFGGIYNIGSGKQYSIGEIVKEIKEINNSEIDPIYGSETIRQNEPLLWLADMTKTDGVFRDISRMSIKDGLTKTDDWFRNNLQFYK